MKLIWILLAFCLFETAMGFSDLDHPASMNDSEKVELLWSEYLSAELEPVRFFTLSEEIKVQNLALGDKLRFKQMESVFMGNKKSFNNFGDLSARDALRIVLEKNKYSNIELRFGSKARESLQKAEERVEELQEFRSKTMDEIVDLVYEGPDLGSYQNADYLGGVKLFLFCRNDRYYPCRFVMKDVFDSLVRNEDGSVWSMPALAKSAGDIPYHTTNGHTPSGVHSMDSVMPEANRRTAFGKFRRVILNWIPSDLRMAQLLPSSALERKWWKEASLARDNGRKWLRIHGTGRINKNPESLYYPHMPTSGCVSVREGKYEDVEFTDQRKILDKIMEAMEIAPVFSNETKIKGMLYVIELDDKKERVSEETLREYGIL